MIGERISITPHSFQVWGQQFDVPQKGLTRLYEKALNENEEACKALQSGGTFRLQLLENEGLVVKIGESSIRLLDFSRCAPFFRELQKVSRGKTASRFSETAKEEWTATSAPVSGRYARGKESLAVAIDVSSAVRNTIAIVASRVAGAVARVLTTTVTYLAAAGGVAATCAGLSIVGDKVQDGRVAYKHGDWEGGGVAAAGGSMGTSYAVVGGGFAANAFGTMSASAKTAAVGLNILYPAGFAMYGLVGFLSSYGLWTSGTFRWNLNSLPLYEALHWIKNQVTIDALEEMELRARGKDLNAAVQKKWDQFQRRTGREACLKALEISEELLAKVQAGDQDALAKAKEIVHEISKANFKQVAKHVLLIAIAVIGTLAFVFGGPVIGHALFISAALLWLLIDKQKLTAWYGEKVWALRERIVGSTPELASPSR